MRTVCCVMQRSFALYLLLMLHRIRLIPNYASSLLTSEGMSNAESRAACVLQDAHVFVCEQRVANSLL